MKKIKCLLVDDEPLSIALLESHIRQLDFMEVTATCSNAVKALEMLKQTHFDLMFLDIQMPKITGLGLLKTLNNPPSTIITTAYREYALEGYDLDIVDYLLKPITFERFFKAVERYLRNASIEEKTSAILPEADLCFYVKSGHRYLRLHVEEVLYIESARDYVKIFTTEGTVISKYKISDLEKELSGKGFLRIHRSFLVNLKKVVAFTKNDVEIGKIELPIGDRYREFVYHALNADILRKL
ncbi:MAG: LytTR family DNA-binding domain-containing protein [Chryseobacterium sp.]|uniref:LytR/AlgR family response regulator transcription factor n=1 Tax=Chryseobacterium sp. TaxID=1871047 RepID=UPI0025BA6064|nr:LytTR family DNA-binding domain-containing protein [Chryseobacterium sp.]MCJ7934614.1 LytTR family DNA-binding domain-containing protein [Chryseobacterium sp.]